MHSHAAPAPCCSGSCPPTSTACCTLPFVHAHCLRGRPLRTWHRSNSCPGSHSRAPLEVRPDALPPLCACCCCIQHPLCVCCCCIHCGVCTSTTSLWGWRVGMSCSQSPRTMHGLHVCVRHAYASTTLVPLFPTPHCAMQLWAYAIAPRAPRWYCPNRPRVTTCALSATHALPCCTCNGRLVQYGSVPRPPRSHDAALLNSVSCICSHMHLQLAVAWSSATQVLTLRAPPPRLCNAWR